MRTRRSAEGKKLGEEKLRNESIWNEKPLSSWKPASAWYPLVAPLRYADDLSLLPRETPAFADPHHCGGAIFRVARSAQPSDQSSTGEPVIRRPWVQEDRNWRLGMVGVTGKRRPGKTIKTLRVVQPCSGNPFRGDGFQIAFGNQTIFPPARSFVDEGRRLSALRPYLTAGLPLSVQSH